MPRGPRLGIDLKERWLQGTTVSNQLLTVTVTTGLRDFSADSQLLRADS